MSNRTPGYRRGRWGAVLVVVIAACGGGAPGDGGEAPGTAERVATPTVAPPVTTGLDSALLARAFARADSLPRMRSLLVARNGELVREAYFHGATAGGRANIKSASKSILSALIGIAIAEGHLEGIGQPIAPFFAEELAAERDPRMDRVTIGHLLSMQAGLESTSFGRYGAWVSSGNWVRSALNRPFVDEPGGRMLYSTGSSHLLSAILTRATGMSTLAYARSRLFEPMGITLGPWLADPQGVYFGGNEMQLRPRELLAFAELYRSGGMHDGRRLIAGEWIETSWQQRTESPFNGHGYGLGWWMRQAAGHDVYFAWGYGGQYAFIVPSLELTVVTTSDAVSAREGDHNRALHRLLGELLVPAAIRGARGAR